MDLSQSAVLPIPVPVTPPITCVYIPVPIDKYSQGQALPKMTIVPILLVQLTMGSSWRRPLQVPLQPTQMHTQPTVTAQVQATSVPMDQRIAQIRPMVPVAATVQQTTANPPLSTLVQSGATN